MFRKLLERLGLVENMARMALSRAGSGSSLAKSLEYTFVFRPGGVAAANVFTTWPTLMAAVALVQGPKLIELDTRFGAAIVSPGAWALDDITWTSFTGVDVLTWPTGTTATGVVNWSLENGATMLSTSAAPIVTASPAVNSGFINLNMSDFGFIESTGAGPFFSIPAGTELDSVLESSAGLGDNVHAVVTVAGLMNISLVSGATLHPNAIAGAGTLNVSVGADGVYSTPQSVTTIVQFPFPSQQVIAHTNPGAIVAGATIQDIATPATISKIRSGTVDVDVQASLIPVGAGGGTVTFRLFRDSAATPIGPISTIGAPANEFEASVSWRDTLPDDAPHTYGWTATTTAGTIAVAIGNSGIAAHEVP
jgi:hypothetical protein